MSASQEVFPFMQVALPKKQRASTAGKLVGTRFQTDLLEAIDQWRRGQPDLPTRPEAVRRLVEKGIFDKSITHEISINGADCSSHHTGE
jgi:hypothetical protein